MGNNEVGFFLRAIFLITFSRQSLIIPHSLTNKKANNFYNDALHPNNLHPKIISHKLPKALFSASPPHYRILHCVVLALRSILDHYTEWSSESSSHGLHGYTSYVKVSVTTWLISPRLVVSLAGWFLVEKKCPAEKGTPFLRLVNAEELALKVSPSLLMDKR